MFKGIIFDFDGVISDSVEIKSDAFAKLFYPYGSDIVKKIVAHHKTNGGMSRYEKIKIYHEVYLNKHISEIEISNLADQFSNLVLRKVIDAPYIKGVLKYIQENYKKCKLFISTGTPTSEINTILEAKKIDKYFTDVFGSPEEKTGHLKMILTKYNFEPNELIFYGDSNSDINAANNLRIPFVLISNKSNKKLVKDYKGTIIDNFIGLL
mgnify:CR=1 FL=1